MKNVRKLISLTLSIAMLATCSISNVSKAEEAGTTIYVSALNGNDSNAGTVDAPVKTIDAARLKAREISGAVTVEIMEGEYRLSKSINFGADDSNVTYKAYGEDKPEIKGSLEIPVSAAVKISEDDLLFEKMTEEAQKEAYVIDLEALGITKDMIVDGSTANGQYALVGNSDMNGFYVNENALNIAQWPNNNDYAEHNGKGTTENSIIYKEDKCDNWADSTGWWVGIWMPHDYSYFRFGGVSIDKDTNTLTYIENPAESYKEGQSYYSTRWKAFNLIEEMDIPGEYYIDRENLKLYFYPTSSISGKTLELEVDIPKLFNISGADNITFEGLTIYQANGCCFYAENVDNVDIKNCTLTDIGGRAIYYNGTTYAETGRYYTDSDGNQAEFWQVQKKNGSYNCDIENNIIKNIGGPAIVMVGSGDLDTLASSNNTIKNNIISNVSTKQVNRAVTLGGCGVTFTNNNVSMARQGALYLYGNNHLVSYNEMYNVLTESSDCGIIYQGQSDVFRGSKVEYNYLHDSVLDDNKAYVGLKDEQCGIYWDDGQTGMTANNNIIKNVKNAFNANQAGDFVHNNNTVVNCKSAWELIDMTRFGGVENDTRTTQADNLTLSQLSELIVYKDLFYNEYENLESIVSGINPKKLSILEGNLNVNSGENIDKYYKNNATFTNNQTVGTYEEKVDLTGIFADPANQDYRVKADSEYANLGVLNEDFDIDLIGIQNEFELTEATAPFEKLYPAKNANIDYQDEYNFTWSPALGANKYKVTVATDAEFKNVVFVDETIQTGAVVTGLSDQTTYYWKVEAENTSRELKNTWTTVEGVTTFGINVSQYQDTVVEMPENQISNYNITTGNLHAGWTEQTLSGYESTTKKVTRSSDLEKESTWQLSPFYLVIKDDKKDAMNSYWQQENNYVMSVNVRDDSPEGMEPAKFNMYYGYYSTRTYTDTYPNANSSMQLTKDWQKFAGSFTIPVNDKTTIARNFVAGIPTSAVIPEGQSIIASDFYLAKEVAYDIEFSGRNILNKNAPTEIDAKVLNQVGTDYSKATGDYTWVVTDGERNVVDGFTVTPFATDSSKVTVSAADEVLAGKYVVVAESDVITKGFEIEVIDDFSDTEVPTLNDNLVADPDNVNKVAYPNGAGNISWAEGDYVRWTEKAIGKDATYGAGPSALMVSQEALTEKVVAGKKYIMSVRLKNSAPDVKETMDFALSLKYNKHKAVTFPVASTEYETYTAAFTADIDSTLINMGFDAQIDRSGYTEFGSIDMDISNGGSLYIAEEKATDIEINGDTLVSANSEKEFTAEVVNQIGDKYSDSEDIQWIVTNADRTAKADGFTITGEGEKITLKAESDVLAGNYALVAIANGIIKGYDFKVISGFEDTPQVEKPENIQGKFHLDGGNSNVAGFTRIDNVEGYTDNNARQWVASQDIPKDANWEFGPVYGSPKDGVTFEGVAGDNYVVSVMVKDASDEGVLAPEFGSMYGTYAKTAYLDTYPKGARMTLTDEWQEYAGTYTLNDAVPRFVFGLPTKEPVLKGQGFVIDDMYIAEEVAYEIKVEGDTKVTPIEPTTLTYEVLNQIGRQGKIDQTVDWFVVDETRTSEVDGFTVQDNNGTVTVSADSTVENGTYVLVAVSNGIVKGTELTVISDFTDTPAVEKPANIQGKFNLDGGDSNVVGFTRTDNVEGYTDSNGKQWVASQDIPAGDNWQFGPVYGTPKEGVTFEGVEGDNYVVSVMVKDASDEGVEAPEFGSIYGTYASTEYLDTYPKGTRLKLTDEWQEYAGTYTLNNAKQRFVFGLYLREPILKGQGFVIDDMYIAEEVAYELKITGKNSVTPSETVTLTAEVLNQIGRKGKLNQEIEWIALNADRSAYATGITLVKNADGTVTVTGIDAGEYTVVAIAKDSGIIKGHTITVSAETEDVEKISEAVFTQTGTAVNFKATVLNTDAENVFFVIGEFNGKSLVKTVNSVVKPASDANCDLTLEGVTAGNTVRAFIWDNGTLLPIDNIDNLALEHVVTE